MWSIHLQIPFLRPDYKSQHNTTYIANSLISPLFPTLTPISSHSLITIIPFSLLTTQLIMLTHLTHTRLHVLPFSPT